MIAHVRLRNSPRERIVLLAGAVAVALGAVVLIVPRQGALVKLTRQAAADAEALGSLQAELSPLDGALATTSDALASHILGPTPGRSALPDLLGRLSALGEACAVEVIGMTPAIAEPPPPAPDAAGQTTASGGSCAVLTVRIEAEAGFSALGRYFEALAGQDIPLTVLSLHLEPSSRVPGDITARFTLGTWLMPEPRADAGGHDAPA